MENTWTRITGSDPTITFISLVFLEMVWNVCRIVLVCTSIVYYLEIIKEVRQNTTIRLSDFMDTIAEEVQSEQEFHSEMINEYPGHGHIDNLKWYTVNLAFCFVRLFLDAIAMIACYFQNSVILWLWMGTYFLASIIDVVVQLFLLRKCTNQQYLRRKWGHFLVTFMGGLIFRLYLIWIGHYLPYLRN